MITGVELTAAESALAERLRDRGVRQLRELELRWLADEADPALIHREDREVELVRRIQRLAAAGVITIPQRWERDCESRRRRGLAPTLPRSIGVVRDAVQPVGFDPVDWPWDPRIWRWLHTCHDELGPRDYERLKRIDEWMAHHRKGDEVPIVPVEERSHDIFALAGVTSRAEKVLGGLVANMRLFGEGRLSLADLRCAAVIPPLAEHRVGDGDTILVAENHATYASLRAHLAMDCGIGAVCWGAGYGFVASIHGLAGRSPAVRRIVYFGDLDYRGLLIPARAGEAARSLGLPSPEPATALYARLIAAGVPQLADSCSEAIAVDLASWLTVEAHCRAAVQLLVEGRRLAQEKVGTTLLGADRDWVAELATQLAGPSMLTAGGVLPP